MPDQPKRLLQRPMGQAYAYLMAHGEDRFIGAEGPRGSGKTGSILSLLIAAGLRWPGSRIFLARAKRASLTQTVLSTLENHVFPGLRLAVPGGPSRDNRSVYHLHDWQGRATGTEIVPLGLDDASQRAKLQSSEWTFGYVAECTECDRELICNLGPTLRFTPPPRQGIPPPSKRIFVDWNPVSPGHWIYEQTEDFDYQMGRIRTREEYARLQRWNAKPAENPKQRWKRIITRYPDNPWYWNQEAWDWSQAGREYYGTLEYLSGTQRRRWLDGEPCANTGSVFPEFSDVHQIEPFTPPADWPWGLAWDPGYAHPTGILWFFVAPNNDIFFADERLMAGESVSAHATYVLERMRGRNMRWWLGDPHEFFSDRAQGKSVATQVKEFGLPRFAPWANQKKHAMVNTLREMLLNTCKGTGRKVYVFKTAKKTINEFQAWQYKTMADGTLPKGDDAYEDADNHLVGDPGVGVVNTTTVHF